MSTPIVTVTMDDNLRAIKRLFERQHFHHLIVLDHHHLMGVISDRDLLAATSPNVGTPNETTHDTATMNKRAHQIMSRHPITVELHHNVYDAIEMLTEHDISCVPVVDEKGFPVGIITWRDVLKELADHRHKLEEAHTESHAERQRA